MDVGMPVGHLGRFALESSNSAGFSSVRDGHERDRSVRLELLSGATDEIGGIFRSEHGLCLQDLADPREGSPEVAAHEGSDLAAPLADRELELVAGHVLQARL